VGIATTQLRDTMTWFQTESIRNMAVGDVKNVPFILLRQLNTSISSPTTKILDINTWPV
jgi:hypothetical protein